MPGEALTIHLVTAGLVRGLSLSFCLFFTFPLPGSSSRQSVALSLSFPISFLPPSACLASNGLLRVPKNSSETHTVPPASHRTKRTTQALFGTFIAACECRALTERRATGIAFAASDHAIFIVSASCAVLLALALSYFVNMGQLWGGHAMHKGAHLSLFLTWGLLASVCVFGILFLPR